MEYFSKLNKAWQEGINAEIDDCDGGERPEIAAAFRESFAHHLLEIIITRKPKKTDLEEIGTSYTDFTSGWNGALERFAKDQGAAIASWVRAHGEFTNYSGLDANEEYEAYIVKASDLSV